MTSLSAGEIRAGGDGCVHILIKGQVYSIGPDDMGMLFFGGGAAPVRIPPGQGDPGLKARGHARLNPSGRSVTIELGAERFMVPRDRFLAVAFGEDITSLVFTVPSDRTVSSGRGDPA